MFNKCQPCCAPSPSLGLTEHRRPQNCRHWLRIHQNIKHLTNGRSVTRAIAEHIGHNFSGDLWQFTDIMINGRRVEVILNAQFLKSIALSCVFRGVAAYSEEFVQLIHVRQTLEDLFALHELKVNDRCSEDIDFLIILETYDDLKRAVPTSDHVAGQRILIKLFREPKIYKFDTEGDGIYHDILRLDIPMHDIKRMQVGQSRANLHHNEAYLHVIEVAIVGTLVISIKLVKIHGVVLKDQVYG